MDKIGDMLGKARQKKANKTPHELAATVDMIKDAGLFSTKYGYTYWLGKVKRAGIGYNGMHSILKDIAGMPSQYSKGGRLTNLLTEKAKAKKVCTTKTTTH